MANVQLGARFRHTATQPVTDADRDDLTGRLNDAFAEGSLDTDTYRRLLDQVYAAHTNGDLVPIAEDLPSRPVSNEPAIVQQDGTMPPGQLAPIRTPSRQWLLVAGAATSLVLVVLGVLLLVVGVL